MKGKDKEKEVKGQKKDCSYEGQEKDCSYELNRFNEAQEKVRREISVRVEGDRKKDRPILVEARGQ